LQLLPDAVVPSKEALADYWTKVAPRALKHLGRRPLKLVRHTKGTTFYHMGPLPPIPAAVHQLRIEKRGGGQGVRLWVDDLGGLLGLVEIGAVELHPWGATVDDIERPDLLVFDLDPGEGVGWDFIKVGPRVRIRLPPARSLVRTDQAALEKRGTCAPVQRPTNANATAIANPLAAGMRAAR
jgi:DNA primase